MFRYEQRKSKNEVYDSKVINEFMKLKQSLKSY